MEKLPGEGLWIDRKQHSKPALVKAVPETLRLRGTP